MITLSEHNIHLSVKTSCILMAAITIARGSSFLLSKYLLTSLEPLNLLGLRFLLAFALLFLLFFKQIIRGVKNDLRIIVSALVLGLVYYLCMAAELSGLKYTASSTCSFLENTAIVIVPLLEAVLLRRKLQPVIIISTVVTVFGIGMIVLRGSGSSIINIGKGEALCLLAALMYAAAIIITDRFSKKHDPMILGILYVGFMGLAGLISSLLSETPHLPESGAGWIALIVLAVLCTAFGFAMQPVAQEKISSETAGIICGLNPLTTAVLGWILLGETLRISGIVGAVLILSGILLPNLKHRP